MPLVPVTLNDDLDLPAATGDLLGAAMADLPPLAPVVIMIHGFRYDPGDARVDPHRAILGAAPQPGEVSWPRHLGLLRPGAGLGVALGWPAAGGLRVAHGRAARAGGALARMVALIRAADPGRRVDLIAHSMGARVALSALRQAAPYSLRRVILLAGAAYRSEALEALAAPAGQTAEVVNVTGRENALFDTVAEWLLPAQARFDRMIGRGLRDAPPRWLDLPLDRAEVLAGLARLGHRIAPPRPVCHWSGYQRPGVFGLYRALLAAEPLPLGRLRAVLPPPRAPIARMSLQPLPSGGKTSS